MIDRDRWSDNEIRLNPSKGRCIHCGRTARLDDDGWCHECDQRDPAYQAELEARALAEAPERYRRWVADWRSRGMTAQADELEAYVLQLEAVRGDVA